MRQTGDLQPAPPARWYRPLAAGFIASIFWTAAFAGIAAGGSWNHFGWLALLGVLLAALLSRNPHALRVRNRLWIGAALFGLGHAPALAVAHAYVWTTAAPAYIPLILYLALFPALAVYIAVRVHQRRPRLLSVAVFPFVWVALEILRGQWLLGGYPWYLLGHALTPGHALSWPAPLIGAYGCSLLLAFLPACIADLRTHAPAHSPGKALSTHAALGLAICIGGYIILSIPASTTVPLRTLRVAVLQTNLPQDNKLGWDIRDRTSLHRRWLSLSEQAAAQQRRPQLIVWPETMFPGYALNPEALEVQRRAGLSYSIELAGGRYEPLPATWFADALLEAQARHKVPFLVGSIAADGLAYTSQGGSVKTTTSARTNSAILITDGRAQSERYDKVDLMAFGEYIPVAHRWPAVQRWLTGLGAQGMSFDLAFGQGRTLFNVEGVRIGTPICFEVCHESSCRAFTTNPDGTRRADLLINLTNDGWFYGSDFNRRMHLLQARWRCAELATPMVRAANTGISCVIDPAGKLLTPALDDGQPLARTEGTLTADVPIPNPESAPTFYARAGHHLNTFIAIAGAALTLLAFWPKHRAAA